MKFNYLFLFLAFGLLVFTSCEKENTDITTTEEENINPAMVVCDLVMELAENPAGTLTASTTGGTLPYAYNWSTGETTNSITPSASGAYSVIVTDAEGCTIEADTSITVLSPCSSFVSEIIDSTIMGGTVLFSFSNGGTLPYAYLWSDGTTTPIMSPPSGVGTYSVTVTDAEGCTFEATITVDALGCSSFTATIVEVSTGVLDAESCGGTLPLAYIWNTGETSNSISVSSGGMFSVTITDAQGNTAEDEIQL